MGRNFTISHSGDVDAFELQQYVADRFEQISSRKPVVVEVSVFPGEVFATVVVDSVREEDWDAAHVLDDEIRNTDPRKPITVVVTIPAGSSSCQSSREAM